MDVFDVNDEGKGRSLLSSEIREMAGKDETTLTDLQMQTYLIISSFRQKSNKAGKPSNLVPGTLKGDHSVEFYYRNKWRTYICTGVL